MSRGFASNYRIVLLATGLFGCFAGLGARLVCLHVVDRDELLRNIVKTRRQATRETARRGDIFDVTRTARFATSRPMIVVAIDPTMLRPEDEAKLPKLAELLKIPLAELRQKATTKYRLVTSTTAATAKTSASTGDTAGASAGSLLKLNLPVPAEKRDASAKDDDADEQFGHALADANDTPPSDEVKPAKNDDGDDDAEAPDVQGRRAIRYAKLSDNVSESTFAEIEALNIRALCPPERRYARVYPHDQLAAHLIGYADREGRGVAGIEAYADFYLRGQDGWREGEKDGRKRELAQFQTREIPKADGYSVVLSINATVQDIVERELATIGSTYQPLKATIIVSDPLTGFVLGLANYPTFNPNEYNLIPKEQMSRMRNVAVSDVYEPGSVFKIVAASGALEEGLVSEDTEFNCTNDHLVYRGKEVKLPGEDHHFDHLLPVREIISKSSNRGAAQLAMELGEDRFDRYARAFGFGRKLGFPVGHEAVGIYHPREEWSVTDFTRIPMGQSIAATALQMHQAMSTIASGGILWKPQLVREIRDAQNNVVYRYGAEKLGQAISARTAQRMARLLQGVASPAGTAPNAAIKLNGIDYEVAGKTGTAQKYMPETLPSGRVKFLPSKKHHVVSFVGFFPASRPQVAISVIVDDADAHAPGGVAYGAAVAAPVFKRIGEKLIPILSITPPNQPARIDFVAASEGGRR
jgi:cell division protein FtsI/penicillin-binding protein 2